MTFEEFKEKYNGGAYTLEDFARGVTEIEGDEYWKFVKEARKYLSAKERFEDMLRKYDIERG